MELLHFAVWFGGYLDCNGGAAITATKTALIAERLKDAMAEFGGAAFEPYEADIVRFGFWLSGYFELNGPSAISAQKVTLIAERLAAAMVAFEVDDDEDEKRCEELVLETEAATAESVDA